jgi:hypothetical protein
MVIEGRLSEGWTKLPWEGDFCDLHLNNPSKFFVIPQNALFVLHKMRVYAESDLFFSSGKRNQIGFRINSHFCKEGQKSEFCGMTKVFKFLRAIFGDITPHRL